MAEAVIVEAVRSPIGKRNGGLSGVHPADLSAQVLNGLVERAGVDPAVVEEIHFGGNTIGIEASQALAEFLEKTQVLKVRLSSM